MKKSIIALCVLLALIVMPVIASGSADSDSSAKKYNINVASTFPPSGHIHDLIVEFKDNLEEATDGRMKVMIHPSGALGGEREIVEGLAAGSIEMGAQGIMDLVMYAPEYTVFEEPFVIRDIDHLNKFWNTIGEEIDQTASEKTGIITAAYAIRGSRLMTSNKEIVEPSDLEGLKFGLPSIPVRIRVFEAFGAVPTVVDFPEVYMALKTGTVDAQENPPETIYTYKYYEAQKYVINSQHIWSTARYQISKKWFDTLSADDQAIVLKAWDDAEKTIQAAVPNPDEVYLEKLVDEGMTIVQPNSQAFRDLAEPVMKELDSTQWVPGLRQRIMEL